MKLLIDMNLSPQWALVLEASGWKAVHWSLIGQPTAVTIDEKRFRARILPLRA